MPVARRTSILALLAAVLAAGCAQQVAGAPSAAAPAGVPAAPAATGGTAAPATLAPGPVTVIGLGDSLTAALGDETGRGFVGRIQEAVAARSGREASTLLNLGQSGWTSTDMVTGQDGGGAAELPQAVAAARAAAPAAVLATVLIGSNDLWYVYQYGTADPTASADEDAAVTAYRTNLERTVTEMQAAGAVVVVGLPDDQSLRPIAKDLTRLHEQLSDVTAEEIGRMSALAAVLARTAREVAAAHGAPVVDTNGPFWAEAATMDPDGIHPNPAGYTELAARWTAVVDPML